MELNARTLRDLCRAHELYSTPELNDKLFLHYKGFTRIQGLEAYTGLRVLYLEGNSISRIEGLQAQQELRCLCLQENCIEELEQLPSLPLLSMLNLSSNCISSLPSCPLSQPFPLLHTLSLAANRIATVDALTALAAHPTLAVLDLSNNRLTAASCPLPALLSLLSTLPALRVLYLTGNELLSGSQEYRRRVLAALPALSYLDQRPVFEDERRLVAGWLQGGLEGEREALQRLRREEREKQQQQWDWFDSMVHKARQDREREDGKTAGEAKEEDEDVRQRRLALLRAGHSAAGTAADEQRLQPEKDEKEPWRLEEKEEQAPAGSRQRQQQQQQRPPPGTVQLKAESQLTAAESVEEQRLDAETRSGGAAASRLLLAWGGDQHTAPVSSIAALQQQAAERSRGKGRMIVELVAEGESAIDASSSPRR